MFKQSIKIIAFALIALTLTASAAFAADGFGRSATGGAGGTTVTVTTAAALETYAETVDVKYIIQVSGTIDITGLDKLGLTSNKTLIGVGTNPTIKGDVRFVSGSSNIIIQGLTITNPTNHDQGDAITVKDNVTNVFITKCTIYDTYDGGIDISNGSDYVTVSWCKFYYSADTGHNFVNLIGGSDSTTTDRGKLHVTFHHNWWTTLCKERMPRVRYGQVHVYNNYYSDLLSGGYCAGVGVECQIRLESNYYNAVYTPWKNYSSGSTQGKIGWDSDNQFVNCTIPTWAPNDYANIFTPPYSYTTDDGLSVPGIVMAGAGAGGGEPPPTNNPPTVSITSPANGATFTAPANITINASASDSDGSVTKVEFYQGSTLLGTDTTSPYSYTWSNVPAGSYSLTADATDNGGAVTTSSAVNITVNTAGNTPPTVSITSPANGATFTAPASVTINATASDSDGTVSKVEFYRGGTTLLGTDTTSPYSYAWTNVAAGSYSLTAKATDNGGAVTTSSVVNITVTTGGAPGALPFSDGFESGNFTAGGWTTQNTNATVTTAAKYTGTYGAKLAGTTWIEKAVSTAGYKNIYVKWTRKATGMDTGERLYTEWYNGSVWTQLESTSSSWATQNKLCPSGANNNANFRIRFRTNANDAATEYGYVDGVSVTGTLQ
jgi:pectate lyase